MRNFQDTFETRERSFVSAFSICMPEPLIFKQENIIFFEFSKQINLKAISELLLVALNIGEMHKNFRAFSRLTLSCNIKNMFSMFSAR